MSWQLLPAAAGNRPPRFVCTTTRAATHRRSPQHPCEPNCSLLSQPEPKAGHQAGKGNKYNMGRPRPGGGSDLQMRRHLPLSVGDLGCAVKSFSRWQRLGGLNLVLVGGARGVNSKFKCSMVREKYVQDPYWESCFSVAFTW